MRGIMQIRKCVNIEALSSVRNQRQRMPQEPFSHDKARVMSMMIHFILNLNADTPCDIHSPD